MAGAGEADRNAAEASVAQATKTVQLPGGVPMAFVWIPPGEFDMGSPPGERSRSADETLHRVVLTRGFWMSRTEVTQDQWVAVMGFSPAYFQGRQRPIEQVSYDDVLTFLASSALREAVGELVPDLPTEAEWEYACRAGTQTRFYFGDGLDCNDQTCDPCSLGDYAWFCGNAGALIHDVGTKLPNQWGLFDMHGNVIEWCKDWLGPYPAGPVVDPQGPESGQNRVIRGGYALFHYRPEYHRSAKRMGGLPNVRCWAIGFRIVLRAPGQCDVDSQKADAAGALSG